MLAEEGADAVGGVMHCFVEDLATAERAMELGFYISFSGIVTFNSARELQAVARAVPADRLLVETDAPYLAPVPYRGKSNQPAYVREVAEYIAGLRGVSYEAIAQQTGENFKTLFRLN
jgi:TatD DNase family protein